MAFTKNGLSQSLGQVDPLPKESSTKAEDKTEDNKQPAPK